MKCKQCDFNSQHCAAGQGFTPYKCEICGKECIWHNTHTPKVCPECSTKLEICEYCMKSLKEE